MSYELEVFYLVFGLVFAGMAVAALPHYRKEAPVRPSPLWIGSITVASAGCLMAVPAPLIGWPIFILVNHLGFTSFLLAALLCRSWRTPVGRTWLFAGLGAITIFVPLWAIATNGLVQRITIAFAVYTVFAAWMFGEVAAVRSRNRSVQLDLLLLVTGLEIAIGAARITAINALPDDESLRIFGEPLISAFLRWVWLALYAGVLMTAGGYTIERLSEANIRAHRERREFEALNTQLTSALEEKSQMLRALTLSARARNMGTMASTLAHELNQPLGAMRLNAEYLLRSGGPTTEEERKALEQILRDNERASGVIARLRSFFTAGSEENKAVDLGKVFADALEILGKEIADAGVQVSVDVEPALVVLGDEGQLQIAFLNVIRNGVEALGAKDGSRSVAIKVRREAGHATGTIADNGPGIPEKARREVFEIYYSTKPEGMGLGLWLSRTIIQRHGGSLSMTESPGGGATFQFSIPTHG